MIAVVGPDEQTGPGRRTEGSTSRRTHPLSPAARIGGRATAGDARAAGAAPRPPLPLALGIGALLLDEAGYAGPRVTHAIAESEPAASCLAIGRKLAASAPRVALLATGDGSARRSVSAPGYLDDRAAPFDEAVEHAVRDGDLSALAALDPALAADLLAVGRPAWQALAGALRLRPPADGDPVLKRPAGRVLPGRHTAPG